MSTLVRVDEPGDRDITATVLNSKFNDNGADGFELDGETQETRRSPVLHSSFDNDGRTRPGGDVGLDLDESEDGGI